MRCCYVYRLGRVADCLHMVQLMPLPFYLCGTGLHNSTENYGRRCLTHFMTSSDRFPIPVRSAVKSNFTNWCCQNLSKRALNALTVQASTTELVKLFQIFTMRAEKNAFVRYDFAIYSGCLWC